MALLDLAHADKPLRGIFRDRLMLLAAGLASLGILGVAAAMMVAL